MKKVFITLLFSYACLFAEITYVAGVIGENPEFETQEGWDREPMSKILNIPGALLSELFPDSESFISITAFDGDLPIGQRNCDACLTHVNKLKENISRLKPLYKEANFVKFFEIAEQKLNTTKNIMNFLVSKGFDVNKIANNSGLLLLKRYEGKGIATTMQLKSFELLKKEGFEAIVSSTTNIKSARVMAKTGFIKFAEFHYKDFFNIDGLDDFYTFWYKEL